MQKLLILLLAFTMGVGPSSEKLARRNVIVVVFAHPDDEHAIGPLLVKYGKTNKIYLIIATDGKLGTRNGYPKGDTLVALRKDESRCSCEKFGIEPPIFLGFADGFDTRDGVGVYMDQSKLLKQQLTQKLNELNPDFIITFGPDGDTGHSDHRMASNMTTEVILKEGWVDRFPLYYLGWTKRDDENFSKIESLNTVDPKYLNLAIGYSQAEEDVAMEAIKCDVSQLSVGEMQEWIQIEQNDKLNTLHFRQMIVAKTKQQDFQVGK